MYTYSRRSSTTPLVYQSSSTLPQYVHISSLRSHPLQEVLPDALPPVFRVRLLRPARQRRVLLSRLLLLRLHTGSLGVPSLFPRKTKRKQLPSLAQRQRS
ncbi:unnamed protein product [Rangifer tarandus platyrhynchus]|uniref:Uncharacterized protein n=1 Tax=Rangifer tarandus platyrhynchus TaxID=3082113 RepID=A0ABN8XKY6_RANTA|nr:unnamed protein product [Rangifer tarandus platyrhynchus]